MQHILNYNTKEATSLHILNDEKSTIMVFVKCFKMTKCASFYSETQTMKNIVERVYFKSRTNTTHSGSLFPYKWWNVNSV